MGLNRATCPKCGKAIMVAEERQGTLVPCPACGERLLLQRPAVGPPSSKGPETTSTAAADPFSKSPAVSPECASKGEPAFGARTTTVAAAARSVNQANGVTAASNPPPLPTFRRANISASTRTVASLGAGLIVSLVLVVGAGALWFLGDRPVETAGEQADAFFDPIASSKRKDVTVTARPPSASVSAPQAARKERQTVQSSQHPERAEQEKHKTPAQSKASLSAGDSVIASLPAVAVVLGLHEHGSGFIAAPKTLVTNYHVIRNSRVTDLKICFPDNPSVAGKQFRAELVAEDPLNDLAVLRVDCDIQPLRIDPNYRHSNGQKVVAIGSPGDGGDELIPNLSTPGRLGPPYKLPNGVEYWTLSTDINAGNSGGPVIDEDGGGVVGVVVAKFIKTASQALAVPQPKLIEILNHSKAVSAADRAREDALHRARFCLAHMWKLVTRTEQSFRTSATVASEKNEASAETWLEAFNQFKSLASSLLSEEVTAFETIVSGEVMALQTEASCEPSVRLALGKLQETTANLVTQLRKPIQLNEFQEVKQAVFESLTHARSLAEAAARSLAVDLDDE